MVDRSGGYHGHMTMADGAHVTLTASEAERLWHQIEIAKECRAKRLPDEKAALDAMMEAFTRLQELGWREAVYCPKDGTSFQVIEAGSTGVHHCHYEGEWPKGSWWVHDGGDMWPSRPILFRPLPAPPPDTGTAQG